MTEDVTCEGCGGDLEVTEDGVNECGTCAWFAATFTQIAVDTVAEMVRVDESNRTWEADAERYAVVR